MTTSCSCYACVGILDLEIWPRRCVSPRWTSSLQAQWISARISALDAEMQRLRQEMRKLDTIDQFAQKAKMERRVNSHEKEQARLREQLQPSKRLKLLNRVPMTIKVCFCMPLGVPFSSSAITAGVWATAGLSNPAPSAHGGVS